MCALARSITYRSPLIYELMILMLYGRRYFARYRAIADFIPSNSSVLDLCCGPAVLYGRYLRRKSIEYTGLDINEKFIKRVVRLGGRGHIWDLRSEKPLPSADYVIMQGSLLYFLPDASQIIDRMLRAARRRVIISEPIRNFASSNLPLLAALGRWLTDPGTGKPLSRFTERTLDE